MEIQITSRHSKASQTLQDTITTELQRMEKFLDKITSCHVILDSEHDDKKVEITITAGGHPAIIANARAENLGKAIDEALEKIERQLKKLNEKIKDHHTSPVLPEPVADLL